MAKMKALEGVLSDTEVADKVIGEKPTPEKRMQVIEKVTEDLNKQLNTTNSIVRLGSKVGKPMPSIPTNLPTVDKKVIQCGGIPRGRIIEIFGPECLSEDTFIGYSVISKEGKRQNHKGGTIKNLFERFHSIPRKGQGSYQRKETVDSSFYASSINDEDRIFSNKIANVVYSGVKPCFQVHTKLGYWIEATAEHKFYDGTQFRPLSSFEVGEEIAIHNNSHFKTDIPAPNLERKYVYIKYHKVAGVKKTGKYVYHRLVKSRAIIEAEMNNLSYAQYIDRLNSGDIGNLQFLERRQHVHHIDEDCLNDKRENLVVLTDSQHGYLHAKERHNNLRFVAVLDEIALIKPVGLKETYDLQMESPFNNFIANNFVVHNSSGKTTFCLHIIGQEQKTGELCAFVDSEHSLDPTWANKLGVDVDNLLVSQPDSGEDSLETVDALIRSRAVSLIVVDSVAALVPQAELEGDYGNSNMGLQARLLSQAMRKQRGIIAQTGVTVIYTNQIREKIGVMFGSPETTTGGRALKFYASLRLDVRRIAAIKDGDEFIGHEMKIKAVKNKVGSPFKETVINLLYASGLDVFADWLEMGLQTGVVEKSGAWYSYGSDRIGQGATNACNTFKNNPELFAKFQQEVLDKLKNP